jgi:peroxiredoxin
MDNSVSVETTTPDLVREEILDGLSQDQVDAYQRFVEWLGSSGVADDALRVGDGAPDFLLPDAFGHLIASRELRQAGPIVISFIRGDWCSFCAAELRAWYSALPKIRQLGARLLIVTPDLGSYARAVIRREGLNGMDILTDLDHGLCLTFGIVFMVPADLRGLLQSQDIDLPKRHGGTGWLLPVPATYVIDRDGVVRHAYVEPDYSRRQSPDAVLKVLREIAEPLDGSDAG